MKKKKTLQTVLSTIVMKMEKRKDSERPPRCSCFTTGSEDTGKWKENWNGNRKQCKNYENSYLCTHTWREILQCCRYCYLPQRVASRAQICMRQWDEMKKKENIGNCLESRFTGCLLDLRPES